MIAMLGIGVLVGLALAVLVAVLTRPRVVGVWSPGPEPRTRGPGASPAVRHMLAERDAEVLRRAGYEVPDEPHAGVHTRPRRAGQQLDDEA